MAARTDLLVVASHAPEMAGLRAYLSDSLIGEVRGFAVRGKAVGIGLAASGPSTARAILGVAPRAVIQLGTCGVYPGLPQFRPHDVLVSSRVRLVSHAAAAGRAEFPGPMETGLEAHAPMAAGITAAGARVFSAEIASTLARTTDDTIAGAVHPHAGAHGENLEAFAVASACRGAGVPFVAVLGVSNLVGSTGSHDYRQFQRGSVTRAAEVLMAWVERGAPGLPHPAAP